MQVILLPTLAHAHSSTPLRRQGLRPCQSSTAWAAEQPPALPPAPVSSLRQSDQSSRARHYTPGSMLRCRIEPFFRSRRRAARAAGQAPAPGLRPWEAPAGRAPGCTVHRTSISGLLAPSHAGASPPAPIGQPSPKRAPVIRTRELPTRHAAGSSLHPHGGPAPLESRWRPPKQRPAPTGHRRSPKKSLGASQRVRGDTTPHPLVNDQCLPEPVKQPENRKLSQTETFTGNLTEPSDVPAACPIDQ